MQHVFDHWDDIRLRLQSASKIGLFLDFDGTLVKFRRRPEQVLLDGAGRQTLDALARNPRFRVVVISGRRQDDVAGRVRLPAVRCLGLHGSEGRPGIGATPQSRHALTIIRGLLADVLSYCPGVWIEDKGDILTIHYRDSDATIQTRTGRLIRAIAGRFHKWVRLSPGKKSLELIPNELADKGEAVRHELSRMGYALPVYVGDDASDEPAFEALYSGITVRVGRARRSHARYHVNSVQQVRRFLDRLRTGFA